MRSNVHPAAAADALGSFGSPVPSALVGGGEHSLFASPISDAAVSSLMEGMSASDQSARARARGVLQSYARERQRVVELEAEVGAAHNQLAQNDALIASLRREVHDSSFAHAEEVRTLQQSRAEVDRRVAALEQELEDASAGFSRKLSEVIAQNRVKEQEVMHFESQLQRSNDEVKRLRAELARQLGDDDGGQDGSPARGGVRAKELEAAQQRAVTLAKKLIDAERGRREAEEALMEDRKHGQGALRTIEGLRQQLADAHGRLTKEAAARRSDEQYYRNAMQHMKDEADKQRVAYQDALLDIRPQQQVQLEASRSPTPSTDNDDPFEGGRLAAVRARLRAAGEQVVFLADQTDRRLKEIETLSEALADERATRVDEHTSHSAALREAKESERRFKRDLAVVKAERTAAMRMIGDLKTLYERLLSAGGTEPGMDGHLLLDVMSELHRIGQPLVVLSDELSGGKGTPLRSSAQPNNQGSGGTVESERLRQELASLRAYHEKEVHLLQVALKEARRGKMIGSLEKASGMVSTPRGSTVPPHQPPSAVSPSSDGGDPLESNASVVDLDAKEWRDAFYRSEQIKRGLAQELAEAKTYAARLQALHQEGSDLGDNDDELVAGSPLSSHYPSPRRNPSHNASTRPQGPSASPQREGTVAVPSTRTQVSAATERLLAEETQSSLKDHIATLHRYIIQLEKQAEADQDELERLRHRYHLLETTHDGKLIQLKKEHALEVQGLLRSLNEIRTEYTDMLKRRQHLFSPTHNDEVDFSEPKHRYFHGPSAADVGSGGATGYESALEKRLDALINNNERRLSSMHHRTASTPTLAQETLPTASAAPLHFVTPTGIPSSRTPSATNYSNSSFPTHHRATSQREGRTATTESGRSAYVMRSP